MAETLYFKFSTKDPEFKTWTVNVDNPVPNNLIQHAFVSTPIYDMFDVPIGYKVSDDYVQQVNESQYLVRIHNTYYIQNKGTISWDYCFLNDKPQIYYPVNKIAASNITSTTGSYFSKTGVVSLDPKEDGTRFVTVIFNF